MTITVTTTAKKGHLECSIFNVKSGEKVHVLSLNGNETGEFETMAGLKYELKWEVWSINAATYSISIKSSATVVGLPKTRDISYNDGADDMGFLTFNS